jgi:hypothetical protein
VYVEPFLGGAAIMLRKRPAEVSIGIDLDERAVDRAVTATSGGVVPLVPGCTFIVGDGISYLAGLSRAAGVDTFVYCDPPYMMQTRRQQRRLYRYELVDADHADLLAVLVRLPCRVMVSGYPSDLYDRALSGWSTIDYRVVTRCGLLALERLWMNYSPPTVLHDYRHLGRDYRERERIRKMHRRWVARLGRMNQAERLALQGAIAEAWPATSQMVVSADTMPATTD